MTSYAESITYSMLDNSCVFVRQWDEITPGLALIYVHDRIFPGQGHKFTQQGSKEPGSIEVVRPKARARVHLGREIIPLNSGKPVPPSR